MITLINTSPNKDGNSMALGRQFLAGRDYGVLHLADYQIDPYGQVSEGDQFLACYEAICQADVLVFTGPIYFWSFPGLLKTFMDRIIDVPYPPKGLRKKRVYLLLQGSQPSQELEALDYAFTRYCRNYGMRYQGLGVTTYELAPIAGWEPERLTLD